MLVLATGGCFRTTAATAVAAEKAVECLQSAGESRRASLISSLSDSPAGDVMNHPALTATALPASPCPDRHAIPQIPSPHLAVRPSYPFTRRRSDPTLSSSDPTAMSSPGHRKPAPPPQKGKAHF
ncbi:hypothetical protein ACJQWK_08573 [Exserohilum turcicum]